MTAAEHLRPAVGTAAVREVMLCASGVSPVTWLHLGGRSGAVVHINVVGTFACSSLITTLRWSPWQRWNCCAGWPASRPMAGNAWTWPYAARPTRSE
jgi:hypothetical protein